MSQQQHTDKDQTQQKHILIVQASPKQQKHLFDLLTQFSSMLKNQMSQVQYDKKDPVSIEIQKQNVAAFGDDTYVDPQQSQKCTWTSPFTCVRCQRGRKQLRGIWNDKIQQWKDSDVRLSNQITKFKENKIFVLGDIRIRSILMAFSSAVMYKVISRNTQGFFRRTRNLTLSFLFMGYWFVPELLNPFLIRPSSIQRIV